MNIRGWIAALHDTYLQEGGRESTWRGDYLKIYKHLDQDRPLTGERLTQLVKRWEPNSRSRHRACAAANKLAKFAQLNWHAGKLKGRYKAKPIDGMSIPSDLEIARQFHRLTNSGWRWVYGAIATYGLRPHEALRSQGRCFDSEQLFFHVPEETKTGTRMVLPLYPEWFHEFELYRVRLPDVDFARDNSKLGHSATEYFSDTAKLPFTLYKLRHAWARRAYEFAINDDDASIMMGHSSEVHRSIYKGWHDKHQLRRVMQGALSNVNRPKPPQLQGCSSSRK